MLRLWENVYLGIHFTVAPPPIATFDSNTVKWKGKPVLNWFLKELFTTYAEETKEGKHTLQLKFDQPRNIEIEGQEYPVLGISCSATRVYKKKRKWVHWSGDAFFDWHPGKFTVPPKGVIVGSTIDTHLSEWPDFEGDIPEMGSDAEPDFFMRGVLYNTQKWDNTKDDEVPDLESL